MAFPGPPTTFSRPNPAMCEYKDKQQLLNRYIQRLGTIHHGMAITS